MRAPREPVGRGPRADACGKPEHQRDDEAAEDRSGDRDRRLRERAAPPT